MNYWWVNQLATGKQEIPGGYIWAPDDHLIHHKNVQRVLPGDILFSHVRGEIKHIGVAISGSYNENKPSEFTSANNWKNKGFRVDVDFEMINPKIILSSFVEEFVTELPKKYSPLNKNGKANQGYLYSIPKEAANILLNQISNELINNSNETNLSLLEQLPYNRTINSSNERATERQSLQTSRVGQGVFRENVLSRWNQSCALTSIKSPKLLIASHIKPWKRCSNSKEKLDPFNGLALAPNYDFLFDKGYISFNKNGGLMISKMLSDSDRMSFGLDANLVLKKPLSESEIYMKYHRKYVFIDETLEEGLV